MNPAPQIGATTVHTLGWGNPRINFSEGREIPTRFVGVDSAKSGLQQNLVEPLALTSADFDEDGTPDLVAGFRASEGGSLSIYRGNVDAIYPNAPEAQERKTKKLFIDLPFLPTASVVSLAERPDFMGTGDFDADGHWDLVTAQHGSDRLNFLRGDGHGNFAAPFAIQLPGRLTALVTGDINRADGLTDVVVGIDSVNSPKVMVFESPEGAMRARAEIFSVPASVTELALGHFNGNFLNDLAVVAGNKLLIVNGRDRRLSLDEIRQAEVPEAKSDEIQLPFQAMSMVAGRFMDDHRTDLALLAKDGSIHIYARVEDDAKGSESAPRWQQAKTSRLSGSSVTPGNPSRLVTTRSASLPIDNLVAIDPSHRTLHILADTTSLKSNPVMNKQAGVELLLETTSTSMEVDGEPTAVLPMRVNTSALNGLIILRKGHNQPVVVAPQASMTFTVTNTDDSGPGSLRQAIIDANNNPGLDTISFNIGTGSKTIALLSQFPTITDPVAIDATTQPGFAGSPAIEVNASGAGPMYVFNILSGNCTLRGLAVNRSTGNAMQAVDRGNNLFEGNYLGTDISGSTALANSSGIILERSPSNVVGGTVAAARNILSGNANSGVQGFEPGSTGNHILGNFIGTNAAGTSPLPNQGGSAVYLDGSSSVVGGLTANARNVVSGNAAYGIWIATDGTLVQGNAVGTNPQGTAAIGNGASGVFIGAGASTIGGTSPNAANIISGNGVVNSSALEQQAGVIVRGTTATGNLIQGNFIGTNVSGTSALANRGAGVFILGSPQNSIGGGTTGCRNLISGNGAQGVLILGSASSSNLIQGNLIGTDATGTAALGNHYMGISIIEAPNTTVGGSTSLTRNIISGNWWDHIWISGLPAVGTIIRGNYIGTDLAGTAALGNADIGIAMTDVSMTTIGGSTSGARNLISGNQVHGIAVGGGSENVIQGNYIGTDVTGNSIIPNGGCGVFISGTHNTVGGSSAGMGNVISGNSMAGINLYGVQNFVLGNFIGTNASGTSKIANNSGIVIYADNNVIGGSVPGAGNVVSGNSSQGIWGTANGHIIQGNLIGTDPTGQLALGNGLAGILLVASSNTTVGGLGLGASNLIASNGAQGIIIESGVSDSILGNLIFGNSGLGIDLGGRGSPLPNDPCDTDTGANNLQNYPVLNAALMSVEGLDVLGTLNSAPNTMFSVDLYSSTACDSSGYGEGLTYLAGVNVTTDGSCNANFHALRPVSATPGSFLTATATDSYGNTSEFSQCLVVTGCQYSISPPSSPSFSPDGGAGSVSVTATTGCSWRAISNAPWVSVSSGSAGIGNGAVVYTVLPNGDVYPRTANLVVAGQIFTVAQNGAPCVYSVSPTSQSIDSSGGTVSFAVDCPAGCSWSASTNTRWLSIQQSGSSVGPGTLQVMVSANTSTSARTGTITLAGKSITVKQAAAVPIGSQTNLTIPSGGMASTVTPGTESLVRTGYATLAGGTNKTGETRGDTTMTPWPYGLAVFSLTQSGVVVSEAGVPVSSSTTQARIFVDYRTEAPAKTGLAETPRLSINTGMAIVNLSTDPADLTFTLRDVSGTTLTTGHATLGSKAHRALFVDQVNTWAPDFSFPADFGVSTKFGSLEISSSQPVSLLALRSTANQRNEGLITTTPVADLIGQLLVGQLYFPQVADGNGFTTGLFLMNTSQTVESGVIHLYQNDGIPLLLHRQGDAGPAASTFSYTIPPGGAYVLLSDGTPLTANTGSAQVVPDANSPLPVGAGVFSYSSGGVLVSESGIPASTPTSHARIYIDRSAGHNTGLAIAVPGTAPLAITMNAYLPDGVTLVGSGSLLLSGNGHDARFANELIPALGEGFTGVLSIAAPGPFVALTLRSLTNARGDFLMTTFPIADFDRPAPLANIFPQIADGGGYRTQFILLNPSGGVIDATLSFFGDDGAPWSLHKGADPNR